MKRLFYVVGLMYGFQTITNAATDCNQVTEIPVSECQALLELYNNTDGENWRNKNGWNEINTPCNWFGIICEAGHVSKIVGSYCLLDESDGGCIIQSMGLKGQLPNLNLPNLQILDLSNNQLNGNIPNFNLPNLRSLSLSNNQLNGNIPNFNLPNLQILSLSNNQLNGNIPNFNLPNLRSLSLSNNQLNGNIPNFNLPNLQNLYLENNQLSGNIPNFNLPNLFYMFLSSNQLSGNIPNFNLPRLLIINLSLNQLSGNIPNFNQLTNLWEIHFSSNQLSGNIPNFSNLSRLHYIDVSSNQLSGNIPINLSDSINLTHNCGLVAYNSEQEGILDRYKPFGVLDWKAQNSDCSKAAGCPLVSVSPNLDIHLPHLNYNNMILSANLRYAPRDGKLLFEVVNYSVNSNSCASANLSPDFKLHIPTAALGNFKLWLNLQPYLAADGQIVFELISFGHV